MNEVMQASASPGPIEPVFHSLLRTMGLVRQVMEPYFARFGISGAQWGILRVLSRAEAEGQEALRLTDLGERLLIRPPSVTGMVDRLERQGLVKRSETRTDLRVRRVGLTPAGRELVKEVLAVHARQITSLFAGLTAGELDNLGSLLKKLQLHLGKLGASPAEEERKNEAAELREI